MGANLWLIIFLPCLGLRTVTPVENSPTELSPLWLELMHASSVSSDWDQFVNMPLVVPCATADDEINQSIELHNNPTKEPSSFSSQIGSIVENRPIGSSPNPSERVTKTGSKRARPESFGKQQPPNPNRSRDLTGKKFYDLKEAFPKSFKLVDFEPSKISGHTAVEAIASLKGAEGRNFLGIDIQKKGVQNMLLLKIPDLAKQNFFRIANELFIYQACSENSKAINEQVATPSDYQFPRAKKPAESDKFALVLGKFASCGNRHIEFYTKFRMENNLKSSKDLFDKVEKGFSADKKKSDRKLEKYHQIMILMPVYLFYVDMINIMIPPGGSIDEDFVDAQRNDAISNFFEFAEKLLLEESTRINPFTKEKEELSILKINIPYIQRYKLEHAPASYFIWKAIHFWLLSSRRELLVNQESLDTGPDRRFKVFFRKLLDSWLAIP